ncbi:MAG: hypothetical protein KKA90_03915 [Nanoarchaeota archaeon]|nr:hypothetical protein [Nanoarchaeota archaeon]
MKRADDAVVRFVLKAVLANRTAHSQAELLNLVTRELAKVDPEQRVSAPRLRRIVSKMPVRMTIATKRGKLPSRCPSCSSAIKKIRTKTLTGKTVTIGVRCRTCSYRGTQGRYLPRRYHFSLQR